MFSGLVTLAFASRLWCRDVSLVYCVFSGLVTLAFASRLWYREVSLVYCVFSGLVTLAFASRLWCRDVSLVYCVFSGLVTLAFASRLWYREVSCVYYVFSVALLRWLLPVTGGGGVEEATRWGGGRKLRACYHLMWLYLLLNRGNSGLLGTPVYYRLCSIWGAAAPPCPPVEPPPPPRVNSPMVKECVSCVLCVLYGLVTISWNHKLP